MFVLRPQGRRLAIVSRPTRRDFSVYRVRVGIKTLDDSQREYSVQGRDLEGCSKWAYTGIDHAH